MATPDMEAPPERKKMTVWLMAGGAASLLIPLAGAIYLHWSQNLAAPGPSGRSDVFERREGADLKITPTQAAVVTSPSGLTAPPPSGIVAGSASGGSSLDFIKSNAEMQAKMADSKTAATAAASTAPVAAAAPAAPPAASTATAKTASKSGKKAFSMPKLQPSRGFTNFGSTGAKGAGNSGAPAGTSANGQTTQDMLKNLPPGSENNPQVQAYLKAHGGQ
jgi:hypothetical protein